VIAAVLTVLAVLVSVWDRIDANNLSMIAVTAGCVAGAVVGVQRALNGQINEHSHQSFTTSLLNFITGTTFLAILILVGVLFGKNELSPLPAGPWWIYTGGVIGVIYIAFTSTIVQHLGVLTFTLFSVGGQLAGSLIIDLVSPTDGVSVSAYLVTGLAMTYIGVIAGGVGNLRVKKPQKQ
jgi:transporter family-2 protein